MRTYTRVSLQWMRGVIILSSGEPSGAYYSTHMHKYYYAMSKNQRILQCADELLFVKFSTEDKSSGGSPGVCILQRRRY